MSKSTLVIGASLKETRFSNKCVRTLKSGNFPVTAIGLREGMIDTTPVLTGTPELENIHTVTLYLSSDNQKAWYDYILKLNPKRVVFNPGAENKEFADMLSTAGIETIEDCTIIMVQSGRY
jgi:predicted CoA-binding protein